MWSHVIACDKREAFAQGSVNDEAIQHVTILWIASLALAMTEAKGSMNCHILCAVITGLVPLIHVSGA